MKKIIVAFIAMFIFMSAAFSQKYIAVDWERNEHYVIDNRVNVRSLPNLSGEKLFQLNAGDKVKIADYSRDWDWLLAEGYYAPWYKISCEKGEGYISGRYVSTKEVWGDFDNDGRDELFACLSITNEKNCPIREYMMSFNNVDVNHVIIKNERIISVDLIDVYGDSISKDPRYEFVEGKGLTPKVNFLVVRTGFGDGGGAWTDERYFYFVDGSIMYFTTLQWRSYEMAEDHSEKLEFAGKTAKIHISHTEYKDGRESDTRNDTREYLWDGRNFSEK